MAFGESKLDDLKFSIEEETSSAMGTKMKVLGVGGGGSNAVARMLTAGLGGVEFYILNTDQQALDNSPVPTKLSLGSKLTKGLAAGSDPEVGKQAALEDTGKIVEALGGAPLDEYAKNTFYIPLGLTSTRFKPREYFPLSRIAPTEREKLFRAQLLRGDVHDPGAAMFGGVAGHAGLFSDAYDIAVIMQMLLNGGTFNGKKYLNRETIQLFTAYHSKFSRRGYGFDKPEKDNPIRPDPYPCLTASPLTFGHTGFTGTCVWADPAYNLIFVLLANRVNPEGGDNKKLLNMNVRGKMQEVIYKALGL